MTALRVSILTIIFILLAASAYGQEVAQSRKIDYSQLNESFGGCKQITPMLESACEQAKPPTSAATKIRQRHDRPWKDVKVDWNQLGRFTPYYGCAITSMLKPVHVDAQAGL